MVDDAAFELDILEGMHWLGITWDEGPYFQKERMDIYREQAHRLLEEGHAYKCYCTAEMLEEKRKVALKEGKKPTYDRTCRDLPEDQATLQNPAKRRTLEFGDAVGEVKSAHDNGIDTCFHPTSIRKIL